MMNHMIRCNFDDFRGHTKNPIVGDVLAPFRSRPLASHELQFCDTDSVVIGTNKNLPTRERRAEFGGGGDPYPEYLVFYARSLDGIVIEANIGKPGIYGVESVCVIGQMAVEMRLERNRDVILPSADQKYILNK